MSHSSTLAPFRPPILTISHFDILGFNPDIFENLSKTFKTSNLKFFGFSVKT